MVSHVLCAPWVWLVCHQPDDALGKDCYHENDHIEFGEIDVSIMFAMVRKGAQLWVYLAGEEWEDGLCEHVVAGLGIQQDVDGVNGIAAGGYNLFFHHNIRVSLCPGLAVLLPCPIEEM